MSAPDTSDTPQPPDGGETAAEDNAQQPPSPGEEPLTAADVKTYATLAHASVILFALIAFWLMWAPPLVLFLFFRRRDRAGLLRRHLGQALSLSAVLTIYALTAHEVLAAVMISPRVVGLLPLAVAAVAAYPCIQAVRAAQRMEAYEHPKALAWIPVDQ